MRRYGVWLACGWLLLTPPSPKQPARISSGLPKPFTAWTILDVFDSAKECREEILTMKRELVKDIKGKSKEKESEDLLKGLLVAYGSAQCIPAIYSGQ